MAFSKWRRYLCLRSSDFESPKNEKKEEVDTGGEVPKGQRGNRQEFEEMGVDGGKASLACKLEERYGNF
jgi:hypothetical protein